MTQEELAEALFVSRTAISKWESGRGYPSIDSLKEISKFFSVSIDDLLSGEEIITIAEKENNSKLSSVCDLLVGFTDLFSLLLIFLPLYPKITDEYIYSVNLFDYADNAKYIITMYWILFIALVIVGVIKIFLVYLKNEKVQVSLTLMSVGLGVFSVLLLAMSKEPYAVSVAFLLLLVKGALLYRQAKTVK